MDVLSGGRQAKSVTVRCHYAGDVPGKPAEGVHVVRRERESVQDAPCLSVLLAVASSRRVHWPMRSETSGVAAVCAVQCIEAEYWDPQQALVDNESGCPDEQQCDVRASKQARSVAAAAERLSEW